MATDKENSRNRKEAYCTLDNLVGISKNRNKFIVYIAGKRIGAFNKLEDAITLRCNKEKELFGEFRYNPNCEKIQ